MTERPASMGRRDFLRLARNAGAAGAVYAFDNSLPGRMRVAGASEPVEPAAETGHDESGSHATKLDYAGAAVFAKGLYELSPKGRGHIGATEYATLGGLIAAKYQAGDEETRTHIKSELKSSIQAFAIIAGTSTAAQGLKIDLDRAYREEQGKEIATEDKVALATMMASCLSPLGTTVASAASLTEEAQSIARDIGRFRGKSNGEMDKDVASTLVDHISNSSGFVLFGDPPWIALVEKYGFAEAVKYQAETMWPLAISSLVSANIKINTLILKERGMSGAQLKQEAIAQSMGAIARNLPFLVKANVQSVANVGRYMGHRPPDPRGFQMELVKVLTEKARNSAKFFADGQEFNLPLHDEDYTARVTDHMPALEEMEEDFEHIIEALDDDAHPVTHDKIDHYLHHADFEGLGRYLAEHGVANAIPLAQTLRLLETEKTDEFIQSGRSGVSEAIMKLAPKPAAKLYGRINLHRTHNALGPQLTDVGNVFPFQAASVIFLTPIFQDGYNRLEETISGKEGVDDENRSVLLDAAGFAAFDAFSAVADNYVAAKIGLDIFPDRPGLVLAASIRGGTKLAISNMANPTLFPLRDYTLADSAKRSHKTIPQDLLAFAYTEGIERIVAPAGILSIPNPAGGAD